MGILQVLRSEFWKFRILEILNFYQRTNTLNFYLEIHIVQSVYLQYMAMTIDLDLTVNYISSSNNFVMILNLLRAFLCSNDSCKCQTLHSNWPLHTLSIHYDPVILTYISWSNDFCHDSKSLKSVSLQQ